METPSEWAKRFNRQKPEDEVRLSNAEAVPVESPASVVEFPSEPFTARRAGSCLPPRAEFAWRAGTLLIPPRSPARKR